MQYFKIASLGLCLLSVSACKRGSGHATAEEDAHLLQVDEQGVRIDSPAQPAETDEAQTPEIAKEVIAMPPIEPAEDEEMAMTEEVADEQEVAKQEPEPEIPKALPVPIADPYPSLAAKSFPKSEISASDYRDGNKRYADVKKRTSLLISQALEKKGLYLGDPVFLRVLKEEKQLQLFIQERASEKYKLAQTYNIAAMSGELGPKTKEGDKQAPEGFYFVPLRNFNPGSHYHLSFNIGYPNKYDLSHERTGSFIMVHGAKASIGCYAMTDPVIEEIYTICESALSSGKQRYFRFHSFPFHMTEENMQKHAESPHIEFWKNLKLGYDFFEKSKIPPDVNVSNKKYTFK